MTAHPQLNITWRGSTAIVSATVETHEQLKAMIRDDSTAMIAAAGIQHRKFTMQAPPGTTLGQLIVSFRNSGVPVRITGKTDADLAPLLQETTEFKMEGVAGKEFFPTVFKTWKAQIEVSDDEVVITFPE